MCWETIILQFRMYTIGCTVEEYMRIGSLTLPLHTNIGGVLQCYALQTVLQRMGHEVYVLNREFG